jgi:hypothetical protein
MMMYEQQQQQQEQQQQQQQQQLASLTEWPPTAPPPPKALQRMTPRGGALLNLPPPTEAGQLVEQDSIIYVASHGGAGAGLVWREAPTVSLPTRSAVIREAACGSPRHV